MPSADFAAAQERIAARRAQREAAARTRAEANSTTHASTNALSRLPYPFNRLRGTGLGIWDAIKGREGTRPEFRVGQVDAELLDEELLELLKAEVGEGLKYFGSHLTDSYTPEILLTLRLALFRLSIWNHNASYGALLQGLRYTDARSSSPSRPPPKPWQKAAYGFITIGGRYAWTKWEEYLLDANEDYTMAPSRELKIAGRVTDWINSLHDIASLTSFLVFLINGRYRTITDRLLRLRLTPSSHATSREVSFEYLNRQLVWHAFTEFLLFLLPLVGVSRWRRILARVWRKLRSGTLSLLGHHPSVSDDPNAENTGGELGFLPQRTCAICYRDQNPTTATEADIVAQSTGGGGVIGSAATDITNPYEAVPCGCIYCFACIVQRIANEEGEGWSCLRCGEVVKECRAWNGDILEDQHTTISSGNGKSVGFVANETNRDEGERGRLKEVDPIPEVDGAADGADVVQSLVNSESQDFGIGESLALTESHEWARADTLSSDEDEQSEEYDEDEEAEYEQ